MIVNAILISYNNGESDFFELKDENIMKISIDEDSISIDLIDDGEEWTRIIPFLSVQYYTYPKVTILEQL